MNFCINSNYPSLAVAVAVARPPSLKERFTDVKCPSGKGVSSTDRIKAQRMESRRNQRADLINNRRVIDESACTSNETVLDSNLQSTFVVPVHLSPRKRKLAFWKAQRDSVRKEEEKRPIFKVAHVDPRIFERPRTIVKSYVSSFSFIVVNIR